jgi:hypothetical protein
VEHPLGTLRYRHYRQRLNKIFISRAGLLILHLPGLADISKKTRSMKDPAIRRLIKATELQRFYDDADSIIVDELSLPVAKARIDIAVINGAFHGFEIKSASDNLQRLPSQIDGYSKVFDYLSVVTEGKYCDRIADLVPSWVGITVCTDARDGDATIRIREPKLNKSKQGFYIAKLLWRNEILDCLDEFEIPFRKKDRNWLLCEALASNLSLHAISSVVRQKLKQRSEWKSTSL